MPHPEELVNVVRVAVVHVECDFFDLVLGSHFSEMIPGGVA